MIFLLQSNGDRSVIHTDTVSEKKVVDGELQTVAFELRAAPIEAPSWIAAKKAFGFELTPLQTQMNNERV